MEFFHRKLQKVVETFIEILPPQGSKISKKNSEQIKRAYNESLAILESHIASELDEEKSLGGLAVLLKAYREKIEEAKGTLTKDFETDWDSLSLDEYRKKGMNEPNFIRDFPKLQKDIKEAQGILTKIQALLQKMLKDGKLKLK